MVHLESSTGSCGPKGFGLKFGVQRPLLAKAAKKKNANDKHIVGLACTLQDKEDAFRQLKDNINRSQCILEVPRQSGSCEQISPSPQFKTHWCFSPCTKSPIQRVFQQGMEKFATIQEPEAAPSRFPSKISNPQNDFIAFHTHGMP